MTEQEKQMIQFMSGARSGNKNLSGVLNNMDSQLLAILAGAYDPRTAEQSGPGAGSYWSRYSQSEDPVIQDVIAKISSGADKYQINSYIDSLAAQGKDLGAFQVSDLKGVATELYKEFTGTGSSGSSSSKTKSDTQKAGIPDPAELYNTSTVPLSTANELYIRKLQDDLAPKVKGYGDSQYQVRVAQRDLARYADSGKDANSSNDFGGPYVVPGKGFVQPAKGYKQKVKNDFGGPFVVPGKGYKVGGKTFPSGKESKESKPYDKKAAKAYDDAMQVMLDIEGKANAAKQREQAVREGQMDYARQSGATPTTDAMKMIMKFISSSK